MPSTIADIRTYLAAQGVTDTIRLGRLTETPDQQVAVTSPPNGLIPFFAMGGNVVEHTRVIQVLVRAAKDGYAAAETLMAQVYGLLDFVPGVTVGSNVYDKITASGQPFFVGDDANERPILSCSFDVWQRG